MTQIQTLTPTLSANLKFKAEYNRTLKWAGLTAVVLTSLMVWLSPQYIPQPYQLRDEFMQIQEVEVIYEIQEPPKVAAPPVVLPVIEAAQDDDPWAVETIDIGNFYPDYNPPANYHPSSDIGFVASSRKPQLVSRPKPHYPEVARMARVEGLVVVKVLVGVDGSIEAAQIVQGAHTLLNNAALKAARRCVFEPGQQREVKVPTWVAVPYNFNLN